MATRFGLCRHGVLNFGSVKNITIAGQVVLDLEDVYVDDVSAILKRLVYNDEAIASYAYRKLMISPTSKLLHHIETEARRNVRDKGSWGPLRRRNRVI